MAEETTGTKNMDNTSEFSFSNTLPGQCRFAKGISDQRIINAVAGGGRLVFYRRTNVREKCPEPQIKERHK